MMRIWSVLGLMVLTAAADPAQQAERQQLIDEHAAWNAEHMAAARRLAAIAGALRRHDTSFDVHGDELRAGDDVPADRFARLRLAHEEARRVHDKLMAEVDALERAMDTDLSAERFRR